MQQRIEAAVAQEDVFEKLARSIAPEVRRALCSLHGT
jgi:hypothetical protein